MPESYVLIYVTCPSQEIAKTLAKGLLENRLAACVNLIGGVTSIYHWQGSVCEESEVLMMIKTTVTLFENVKDYVENHHPYDVPEVVALNIDRGSDGYLGWISDSVRGLS